MQGRTIIITGATSGIGRATALYCARQGANVVAAGRRQDLGDTLVGEISRTSGAGLFIRTDVTQGGEVKALVQRAVEHFGSLDFAFNNAGIFEREPDLHEYDDGLWDRQLAVGLSGVYHCMKHQLNAMLADNDGQHRAIINNASTVGHRGSSASGAGYTAVKHGIIGLTRQAAVEYAHTPIRINAVCPGPTLTEATAALLEQDDIARRAFLSTLNPTSELVDTEDIAASVVFLCSSAASMINGHTLPLDGGQLAKL